MMIMLNLGAWAQEFDENSLYAEITGMDDSDYKLEKMLAFCQRADNIARVRQVSLDALGLATRLNDYPSQAKAYSLLGWVYCTYDANFARAREYWLKALAIDDSLDISKDKVLNQINIASTFFNENRLGNGIRYLEYAENEVERSGSQKLKKHILSLKGWAYSRLEFFDEANKAYYQMADICRDSGDSAMLYQAYYGIASNYLRKSQNGKHGNCIDSALAMASQVEEYYNGSDHVWMQVYQMFPLIYLESARQSSDRAYRQNQLRKAKQLCETGLALSRNTGMKMYKDYINAAKAELLIYEGKLQEAKMLIDLSPDNVMHNAKIKYMRATGDYEGLLKELERQQVDMYRDAAMQSVETIMQSEHQQEYEQKEKLMDAQAQERNKINRRQGLIIAILKHILKVMIVLAMVIVAAMVTFWIASWRHNKLMQNQNQILYSKNHQLEQLVEEEYAQNGEIMRQSHTLASQNRDLRHQLDKLMSSMEYAKRIQDAVIPSPDMMRSIFGECLIYYRPLEIVSGDFYWAVSKNGLKLLAVCDCTGHSVPGALLSILGVSFLYDITSSHSYKTPDAAAILNELRRMIMTGIGEECDDGMDMALVIYDQDERQIHYAGAMRPLYLMRGGQITVYKPNRMPIGRYVIKGKPFTDNVIDTMPNDRLYMFSDGITDVFNDDRSKKYSEREFREMLQEFNGMDFASQKKQLEAFYEEWGSQAIIDDQLLVGIELPQ